MKPVEALCISYRKLAGGGRAISFRIHSDDAYLVEHLEPNRRYALDIVEIGDDEKPVKPPQEAPTTELQTDRSTPGPRGRGSLFNYPRRSGILRNDPLFQKWVSVSDAEAAAKRIRDICQVNSCADIEPGTVESLKFDTMDLNFKAWKNKARYVEEAP